MIESILWEITSYKNNVDEGIVAENRCSPTIQTRLDAPPNYHLYTKKGRKKRKNLPASRKSEFMRDCDPCLVSSRQKWFSFLENLYYHSVAMDGISQCYSPGKLERLFSGKSFLTKSKRDRSPFHLVVVRKAGAIVFLRPVGFVSRDWKRTSSSCLVGLLFWKKLFKQR
ncbi:hypothetical protein CEXT_457891 [Caerostris extrusa]|uniref:Maturase K n=1 Tax=Caerostris extrusa TaxID=172846 RepID=A0AAV4P052_CAEEX|nr:hypothetical protein CEXT_457891 [Caerostris extrusa]